jgi:transposase
MTMDKYATYRDGELGVVQGRRGDRLVRAIWLGAVEVLLRIKAGQDAGQMPLTHFSAGA